MINARDYEYAVSAAGRVNIIGEHIDYCGGKVFPAALELKNTVYIRPNGTDKINIEWRTSEKRLSLDINALDKYRNAGLGSYQAGSLYVWQKLGHKIVGCDMYQDCTVPFGSGLSSSAAIEVSTIAAMCAITGEKADSVQIALAAQRAEREYMGVNCGIMDQYASACGKRGYAMLLDCATLDCEYIPLETGEYSFIIIDSKKPHSLIESKYNERRAETDGALETLKKFVDINSLSELDFATLEAHKTSLSNTVYKRVKHVVGECERVKKAEAAMKNSDMKSLGALLNASHDSLRDLYEVTGRELDALSAAARRQDGCVGSRMTGGGFGGCTVSLVLTEKAKSFEQNVLEEYKKATGYTAEVYSTGIGDGITVTKIGQKGDRQI